MMEKDWFDALLNDNTYNALELSDVIRTVADMKRETIPLAEGERRLAELSTIDVRREFAKLFFRPVESNQKVNISFQSHTHTTNTRTSASLLSNKKYSKGTGRTDFTLSSNEQFKPKPWITFSLGTNILYSEIENNGATVNELNYIPQTSRILGDNGEYLNMYKQGAALWQTRRDSAAKYNLPYDWDWNLKREINNMDNTDKNFNLKANTRINIMPVSWLNLELYYQYEYTNRYHREYYNVESWTVRHSVNDNARPDGTYPIPLGGMLYERKGVGKTTSLRTQFVFDKAWNAHAVKFLGGIERRRDYYDEMPYGYYGYDPQSQTNVTAINFKDPVTPKMSGLSTSYNTLPFIPGMNYFSFYGMDNRYLSYYGNAGYTYDTKYDLTGSIRLDKTNLYGSARETPNLPQWSVGVGWNVTEEDFSKPMKDYVSYLKLRFSYGWNGHIDKSASPFLYGYAWTDPLLQISYYAVQTAPNPTLTWEKTATYNLGLDFNLINKVNGTFNFYKKMSKDILAQMMVNGTYGFQNNRATVNAGEIHNTGVELNLSSTIINNGGFSWQTLFNISYNRNVAKNISNVNPSISSYTSMAFYYHKPDRPVSYLAAVCGAGYDENGYPQFHYGDSIYSVANSPAYGTLNLDTLFEFVGQRDPKFFGTWNNTFSYKGLSFSIRLLYKFGHKFLGDYPAAGMAQNYFNYSKHYTFLPEMIVNRWTPNDKDNPSMYSLENKITNTNQNTLMDLVARYNTENLLDAGQIRLQSISLGYQIPKKIISALGLNALNVLFESRNLGPLITLNGKGIDPDNPPYSSSTYGALMFVVRNRPEYSLTMRINF